MKEGWTTKKLGEIGTFERGGGFLKNDYVQNGYPCLHYGQIHTILGVATSKHLTCIPESLAKSKSKIAKTGDVILAITSEDVEGSCKCTAWIGDYDIAVGGHTAIFHHSLNPFFVSYYFRGRHFQKAKERYTHGFKVVEIKPSDISTIDITYPPLAEQERIVAELDLLTEIIDKQKAQLKELDTLAQSIFYDMFGDPVENKKGWVVEKLKTVAPQKSYQGCVPNVGGKYWLLNLDKVAQQTGVVVEKMLFDKADIGNSTIAFDTTNVLYSKLRPYLNKVVIPDSIGYGTSEFVPLQPKSNILNRIFFANLLRSKPFVDYISIKVAGAKMPRVSMDVLRDYYVIIPPLSLQQSFADKINVIEQQKAAITQSIAETQKLFDYTMDKYFG